MNGFWYHIIFPDIRKSEVTLVGQARAVPDANVRIEEEFERSRGGRSVARGNALLQGAMGRIA